MEDVLLTTLGRTISADIPNKGDLPEQIAQLDSRVFDLQSLLKAGEALHNKSDVQGLYDLVIAMVRERAGTDQIALIVHDEDKSQMEVVAQTGLTEKLVGLTFPAEDGIMWRLVLAGEPLSVVDRRGEPRFPELFKRYQLQPLGAVTWIPMILSERVVGLLSLGTPRDHMSLQPTDLWFVSALASQAAGAVSRSRLYESITVARKDLNRSLHNLSMLFDVTRALGAVSDLTGLLKLILTRAMSAVEAEKGSLMLLDESSDELVIRVVQGLPDKEVERQINEGEIHCKRFARGEGVAGQVLESGKTVRIADVSKNEEFTRRDSSHVSSILCVPLDVDDEIIGVINITNRQGGGSFEREDESILEALGNQAAVAIARTRLYEAAITDSLTGLYIRRFIMHRLGEEIRRARRYGAPLSLVMCDIDHFKRVNDTYGHPAGDAVIVAVAKTLRDELRQEVDVAGRYGGEEFLLLLPQTDAHGAASVGERLRESIESLVIEIGDGQTLQITMSFGVSHLDLEGDDGPEAVLKRADDALYVSKETGRNKVSVSDPVGIKNVHVEEPEEPTEGP